MISLFYYDEVDGGNGVSLLNPCPFVAGKTDLVMVTVQGAPHLAHSFPSPTPLTPSRELKAISTSAPLSTRLAFDQHSHVFSPEPGSSEPTSPTYDSAAQLSKPLQPTTHPTFL